MRAVWIKLMFTAARLPLRNEPANNQFERRPRPDLVFDCVVIYGHSAILGIASQCSPALEAVIQSFGDSRPFGHKIARGQHPGMQCAEDGCRFFLVYSPAISVGHPLVALKLKVPPNRQSACKAGPCSGRYGRDRIVRRIQARISFRHRCRTGAARQPRGFPRYAIG